MIFFTGLFLGVALGMLVLGFLATNAYGRGYDDATLRRREWRAELLARHPHHTQRALGAHA